MERAAAYAAKCSQEGFICAALLDLKSACDSVSCQNLLNLCNNRLPLDVSLIIPAILTPIRVETMHHVSKDSRAVVIGVPLGDSLSLSLLNIFLDIFLGYPCRISRNVPSCIADDVVVLAENHPVLLKQHSLCNK